MGSSSCLLTWSPHAASQDEWRVVTQTGTMYCAGTDAPVRIQIWGPNGMLGGSEMPLNNSNNDFERSAVDTFVFDIPKEKDCGTPLQKVWGISIPVPGHGCA